MTDSPPLVSIGMPVYNGEQTIRQALDTLLSQDYENFELIISDNASTDITQTICMEYAARDQRIRYYRNEVNKGSVWNFNRVFELASGKYFTWAAHDDWHTNDFISKCVLSLERNPSAGLCYPLAQFVDKDGRNLKVVDCEINTYRLNRLERLHTVILRLQADTALYGVIRADALRRTSLAQYCFHSDKSLLYQLAILGDIIKVPEVLHYYCFMEKSMEHRIDQQGLKRDLLNQPIAPILSLTIALMQAIVYLPIYPVQKPFLMLDALYCLRRRYRNRINQELHAVFNYWRQKINKRIAQMLSRPNEL